MSDTSRALEIVAEFGILSVTIAPVSDLKPGELLDSVKAKAFAEVVIPHQTDDAICFYTFHILNVPKRFRPTNEAQALGTLIGAIHEAYNHLAVEQFPATEAS